MSLLLTRFGFFFSITLPTLFATGSATGQAEPLPEPRQTEVLTVMPRRVPLGRDVSDRPWLIRGALRDNGTYENPLPISPQRLSQRQIELLRTLDQLKLFDPVDDLDSNHWDHLRKRFDGPEVIPIAPRVVH